MGGGSSAVGSGDTGHSSIRHTRRVARKWIALPGSCLGPTACATHLRAGELNPNPTPNPNLGLRASHHAPPPRARASHLGPRALHTSGRVLAAQPGHLLERVRLVLLALALRLQPRPPACLLALRPAQLVHPGQLVPLDQRAALAREAHGLVAEALGARALVRLLRTAAADEADEERVRLRALGAGGVARRAAEPLQHLAARGAVALQLADELDRAQVEALGHRVAEEHEALRARLEGAQDPLALRRRRAAMDNRHAPRHAPQR